jgi:hypothetical protein
VLAWVAIASYGCMISPCTGIEMNDTVKACKPSRGAGFMQRPALGVPSLGTKQT